MKKFFETYNKFNIYFARFLFAIVVFLLPPFLFTKNFIIDDFQGSLNINTPSIIGSINDQKTRNDVIVYIVDEFYYKVDKIRQFEPILKFTSIRFDLSIGNNAFAKLKDVIKEDGTEFPIEGPIIFGCFDSNGAEVYNEFEKKTINSMDFSDKNDLLNLVTSIFPCVDADQIFIKIKNSSGENLHADLEQNAEIGGHFIFDYRLSIISIYVLYSLSFLAWWGTILLFKNLVLSFILKGKNFL